ncbi:MAG: methyltransferase [Flavobacteriia bacterium]|nr:MAG: methyltransferase [Flavobacteriia bacterium]
MENKKEKYLTCKDHTVSQEYFDLLYDKDLDMLITSPQPELDQLGAYYESDAYISHTDSKSSFTDKLYQWVKNYTLKQKVKLIDSFKTQDKELLDIGCGTGDFLKVAQQSGWKVSGAEPNKKARQLAYEKLKQTSGDQNDFDLEKDIQFYLEKGLSFDVISMWHVLEHVPNPEQYISELKKLLKPEGVLIIAVPNFKSYDANYYKRFWAAYDVPRHLWHFSQRSISLLFSKQKMKVVKTLPMKFDSFYVSMLSEKYKNQKGNLLSAFKTGLLSNLKAKSNFEYSSLIYLIKHG